MAISDGAVAKMVRRLRRLEREQLKELKDVIEELLARPPRGAGCVQVRYIRGRNGKLYGPYMYYRWYEGGKARTKYVGRAA